MIHNNNNLIKLSLLLATCTLICAAQLSVNLSQATISPVGDIEKKHTTLSTSTSTTTSTTSTTTTTTTTPPPPTTSTTPKTTTTTVKPDNTTTTSTAAPITTTTPAPGPYPAPSIGTWNSSCIMVKMAAQLNFTYETKENKTATALYNIPVGAVVDHDMCDNKNSQSIQINWGPAEAVHSLLLQFDMKNKTAYLVMIRIILPLTSDKFPDAKDDQNIQLIYRGSEFGAPANMSYHCTRTQHFNLTETVMNKDVLGTIVVHDVQVEAFRTHSDKGFSMAKDCDSSETSDIVPIAVGIALAALILIVLISYLCARRRSSSRGYMSF